MMKKATTPDRKKMATVYYKYGNNIAKLEAGTVTYCLNHDNEWAFNGDILGDITGLNGIPTDDPERLPDLAAAKAWYKIVTGGKAWVP